MFVGILLASSVTAKAWQRFQQNPMLTSLILSNNNVYMYPTVSVCPQHSENSGKILKIIAELGVNDSQEIEEFLGAIPNFSYGTEGLRSVVLSHEAMKKVYQLKNKDVRSLAFKLATSCRDIFAKKCNFKEENLNCCDAFLPVYGEHGLCYAFNAKVYGENE